MTCISYYRLPFWTNYAFTSYLIFLFVLMSVILLHTNSSTAVLPGPDEYATWLDWLFLNTNIPTDFRIGQFFLMLFHLLLALIYETKVVNWIANGVAVNWKVFLRDWQRERLIGAPNYENERLVAH